MSRLMAAEEVMVAIVNHLTCLPFLSKQCRQRENKPVRCERGATALMGMIFLCSS